MTEWTDLFADSEFRHWVWWTVIPLSIIGGLVIVSSLEKFFDRNNTKKTAKYTKSDK